MGTAVVACTPPIAAEPPNNEFFVLAVESKFPEECSRLLELIGSVVVAVPPTTHDIYEPIVCYLGWREELSSAGTSRIPRLSRCRKMIGVGVDLAASSACSWAL
jgi:hypothetical protein